jgi:uncharacterized protein YndB with AHSA1/START domain
MTDDANAVAMHPTALAVRKSITVDAPVEKCFEVFTDGINSWWPREHHIGDSPMADIKVEPRVGGRCYTIMEDGKESQWATVLAWEPPARLVIGWHITAQWQLDTNFVTEVEVTFASDGPDRTLVELEHRNLDRYAEASQDMIASLDSEGGWPGSLALFKAAAEGNPSR